MIYGGSVREQDLSLPRSRFYPLEPRGIGTPWVESLTSYIARLAKAHCVTTKVMVMEGILPCQGREFKVEADYSRMSNFWRKGASSLNGIGSLAEEWVGALELLTSVRNLHSLTMLTWKNVLSIKGLVRQKKAWCPLCLDEWRNRHQIIYEPLLWMLNGVNVCLSHQRLLVTVCPTCHGNPSVLMQEACPGYCSLCQQWMGSPSVGNDDQGEECPVGEYERQCKRAEAAGNLLAVSPTALHHPPGEQITYAVKFYMTQHAKGDFESFVRLLEADQRHSILYHKITEVQPLETILDLCFASGITATEFLTRDFTQGDTLSQSPAMNDDELVHPLEKEEVDFLLKALDYVLSEENGPLPSIKIVACRLGYASQILRKYFPDHYQAIRAGGKNLTFDGRKLLMQQVLVTALASDEVISLETIAQRLRCRIKKLRSFFPDLCNAINLKSDKKAEYQLIERYLQELLSSAAPMPTIRELSIQFRFGYADFRRKFSDLCGKIIARRVREQRALAEQNKESLRQEARRILLEIHQEGVYPGRDKLLKRLGKGYARDYQEVWRTSLEELGYK